MIYLNLNIVSVPSQNDDITVFLCKFCNNKELTFSQFLNFFLLKMASLQEEWTRRDCHQRYVITLYRWRMVNVFTNEIVHLIPNGMQIYSTRSGIVHIWYIFNNTKGNRDIRLLCVDLKYFMFFLQCCKRTIDSILKCFTLSSIFFFYLRVFVIYIVRHVNNPNNDREVCIVFV